MAIQLNSHPNKHTGVSYMSAYARVVSVTDIAGRQAHFSVEIHADKVARVANKVPVRTLSFTVQDSAAIPAVTHPATSQDVIDGKANFKGDSVEDVAAIPAVTAYADNFADANQAASGRTLYKSAYADLKTKSAWAGIDV